MTVYAISHFWPTSLGAWAAVLAALGGVIASIASVLNRGKIAQVHMLVNGRLTGALADIAELKATVGIPARRTTDPPPEGPDEK